MKTHFLVLLFVFALPFYTLAQYWDNPSMANRNLAIANPAHASFNNDIEISLSGIRMGEADRYPYSVYGLSSYKFNKIKSTVGLAYNHFDDVNSKSNNFKLNYNFQPISNGKHKLSIGLSAAYSWMRVNVPGYISDLSDYRWLFIYAPPTDYEVDAFEEDAVYFGAGFMYSFKNIQAGFSFNDDMRAEYRGKYWNQTRSRDLNVYLSYSFKLSSWARLNPWINVRHYDYNNYDEVLTAIHLEMGEKFVIGPQIGWDVNQIQKVNLLLAYTLAEKMTMSFSYGANTSRFTNQTSGRFEFGLFYGLTKESNKRKPGEASD